MPSENNQLAHEEEFPDPVATLAFSRPPLVNVFDQAVVYLDASVLLGLYETTSHSLKEVERVYKRLIDANRLIIPIHALREFLRRQDEKVGSISASIKNKIGGLLALPDWKGTLNLEIPALVRDLSSFEQLTEASESLGELQDALRPEIEAFNAQRATVIERLRDLEREFVGWVEETDPVRESYAGLFDSSVVYDSGHVDASIAEEAARRREYSISPLRSGEPGKSGNEFGDLLIWLGLLNHARDAASDQKGHPAVFVTNDLNKGDWATRAGNDLITRRDLIEEYRAATQGQSFYVVTLGRFLELAGATSDVVEAVEEIEPAQGRMLVFRTAFGAELMSESELCDHVVAHAKSVQRRIADFSLAEMIMEDVQQQAEYLDTLLVKQGRTEKADSDQTASDLIHIARQVAQAKRRLYNTLRELARRIEPLTNRGPDWILSIEGDGLPSSCALKWNGIRQAQVDLDTSVGRLEESARLIEATRLHGFDRGVFIKE